jgi:hypothetical protein
VDSQHNLEWGLTSSRKTDSVTLGGVFGSPGVSGLETNSNNLVNLLITPMKWNIRKIEHMPGEVAHICNPSYLGS